MKKYLLLIFCFVQLGVNAQNTYINAFVGVSNYQGDLQSKIFVSQEAKLAIGAGMTHDLSDHFAVRWQLTFATVGGNDKYGKNVSRNLSFASNIYEGVVAGEYYLRNLKDYSFTPYAFAGIGIFHFNPYTKDAAGRKIFLWGLNTEGQGFSNNRSPYTLIQFSIPFGGGIKYALNENMHLGLEMGLRKLFTDYLDDVSTTYVDQNVLLTNRGAKAVELAYRGDELPNGKPYPAAGTQRASPKYKDWFYFGGITASFKLSNNSRQRY